MVPTLTDAEDLQLRSNEIALSESAATAPEAVGAFAASLLRQNALQERIIRQATHRIAELEAKEALADRQASRPRNWWRWHR